MKPLLFAFITTLALAGTARAQEPKTHEHEQAQPPAVAEQKDDKAAPKEMCACCKMDGAMAGMKDMAGMKEKMQEKMKEMKK